jgi:hypothetical protein
MRATLDPNPVGVTIAKGCNILPVSREPGKNFFTLSHDYYV